MKYFLKIHRRLLRFGWFRNIAALLVKDYNLINEGIIYNNAIKLFRNKYGLSVIYGPFTGMKYASLESYGSKLMPKLMGTYEHEIHHIFDDLSKRKNYNWILDIGAAEGYYAVGLATLFKNSKVIAFETSDKARELITQMASTNNVSDSIQIEGECTVDILNNYLTAKNGLIICDCEGFELELLDPEKLPNLKYYDIIVELHDYSRYESTMAEIMKIRFEKSHNFTFINIRRNKPITHLKDFKKEQIVLVTDENRAYSIGWAFMESNHTF